MKKILLACLFALALIGGALLFSQKATPQQGGRISEPVHNVSVENGVQVITLSVKGGYTPQQSVAQKGMPTILRFKTNSTFDCSSSLQIPSMQIRKNLPPTGTTDIDLGTPQAGMLEGTCGMGMYSFAIEFQ